MVRSGLAILAYVFNCTDLASRPIDLQFNNSNIAYANSVSNRHCLLTINRLKTYLKEKSQY